MSIEEQIDNAIRDYGVSPDAMRWTPDQTEDPAELPAWIGGIRGPDGGLVVLDEAHVFRHGGGWGVTDSGHGWSPSARTAGDYAVGGAAAGPSDHDAPALRINIDADRDVSPNHFHIDLRAHAANPAQARRAVESAIEDYMREAQR